MNQSKLEVNTYSRRQARKTRASKSIGFGLLLISWESGEKYFSQSQSVAKQNQGNCEITLDTQLKTALKVVYLNQLFSLNWFVINV